MGKRERHIRELAAQMGVEVRLSPSGDSAYAGRSYIKINGWNPRSKTWYITALHELGHHACKHTGDYSRTNYRPRILEAEAEAWEWAFRHSLEPVGSVVRSQVCVWLGWYIYWNTTTAHGPVFRRVAASVGLKP